jgi:hypothetical protein
VGKSRPLGLGTPDGNPGQSLSSSEHQLLHLMHGANSNHLSESLKRSEIVGINIHSPVHEWSDPEITGWEYKGEFLWSFLLL